MQPFIIFLHLSDKFNTTSIMKKIFGFILTVIIFSTTVKASHINGGDFYIKMDSVVSTGAYYTIKLRVYRDNANSTAQIPTTLDIGFYDPVTHASQLSVNLTRTSLSIVPLGDPCYSPDPNVVSIQEGIFENTTTVFLPNNTNGYYVQSQVYARNSLAINIPQGGNRNMTWLAMIPDPAIGMNSTPDFGNYPADAYFCVNSTKTFSFPLSDVDGDSLVYSFVEPLGSGNTTNGTVAGAGAYPFYQATGWINGYNLSDIIGGIPPMSIDPATGIITATPVVQGFFSFVVRVEEFRDTTAAQNGPKIKIGEIRRELQYQSLNCTSGSAPQFLNSVPTQTTPPQTLQIEYNKEFCKDLIFNDLNATDTLYMEMVSPIFDSGAYQATITPDMSGNLHYFYNETFYGSGIWQDSVVLPPNQSDTVGEYNIGTVAQRFCWTPKCDELFGVFPFQVNAFSLGCDGKAQDSIIFNIEVVPPPATLFNPGNVEAVFAENKCVNILFEDSNIVDTLNISITSDIFDFSNAPAEFPTLDNNYIYSNGVQSVVTGAPNNAHNPTTVATQYCWQPDCEHIGGTFSVTARMYSVECPEAIDDTIQFDMTVLPPFDSLDVVPNVITPNGDGLNDTYTLGYFNNKGDRVGGTSNPCTDAMNVKIFNRWGMLVYESEVFPEFEWDGTFKGGGNVPDGTYFVLLEGVYGNEPVVLSKRTVTILRGK